jgi:hypothetical protein
MDTETEVVPFEDESDPAARAAGLGHFVTAEEVCSINL